MKRGAWRRLVFGLIVIAVALLVVGSSPTLQQCIEDATSGGPDHALKEKVPHLLSALRADRACVATFIHDNGEAIIALFTIILGFATWLLWKATRDLVDGAEKTAERQLRAYVNTMKGMIVDFGTIPVAKVAFKNNGTTPAYAAKIVSGGAFAPVPLTADLHSRFDEPKITAEQKAAISKGAWGLYVFGKVAYRDAFGKDQSTKFRLLYSGDDWIPPEGGMTICGEGNDAT